jgi:alpha-galactosidase
MPFQKIACLGGGSFYYPGAMIDLVQQKELAGSELVLYDIDAQKLEMMSRLGKRLARDAGTNFKIRYTLDLADALDGAHFALSSIGGSGAEVTANVYGSSFHASDMHIPAKYGIHQVIGDTCGPAAMMMALRSVPVYLKICREMERRCPSAILFNHSNPMAVLMRAMHKYSSIRSIGVCHGVQGGIAQTAKFLGVEPADLQCTWIGTNHYYWFTRVLHKGRDIYPELLERIRTQPAPEGSAMAYKLSAIYNHVIVYAADDHIIEFYNFLTQVPGGQKSLPYNLIGPALHHDFDESRPPAKPAASDRPAFFKRYAELLDRYQLPRSRRKDHHGEEIGATLAAIATGQRRIFIANIANNGAIPNLPATAEVEVESLTDWRGVRAVSMGDCPPALKGLLEKRFVWHELVADAAVTGDRNLALQALMLDEMSTWPEQSAAMLDELLLASKKLLPQFFRRR